MFDREEKDIYYVTIIADDGTMQTEEIIKIDILDVNDNYPKFDKKVKTLKIYEDQKEGALENSARITAQDADIGIGGTLGYRFKKMAKQINADGTQVEIRSSDLPFAIDENGSIIVKYKMEAEKVSSYEVDVIVQDGFISKTRQKDLMTAFSDFEGDQIHEDEQKLIFKILDVNEHPPEFRQEKYIFTIDENNKVSTEIGYISAMDADRDSQITFEIMRDTFEPKSAIKDGKLPFRIGKPEVIANSSKGERTRAPVYALRQLDREDISSYSFKIRAIDANREGKKSCSGNKQCKAIVDVVVSVNDKNDNSPELCSGNTGFCATDQNKLNLYSCNMTAGAIGVGLKKYLFKVK